MRRPELSRQEIEELIRIEEQRLPALKQAVHDAEQANDLQSYRKAKPALDDCLKQITSLDNKLHPYSIGLGGGCPDCGGVMSYGDVNVHCTQCGGDGNPTKRIGVI